MATVLARGQLFGSGATCRPSGRSGPVATPRPAPFLRVRVARPMARSSCGGYSQWDPASADAARRMWGEFSRACKPGRYSNAGGFFWPSGGFYMGSGAPKEFEEMMKKWQQQQQQGSQAATDNSSGNLPLDVIEDELKYTLFADVPGLAKPDLSIRLSKENVLSISGERKSGSEEGVVSQERPVGAFKRQWTLPVDADGAAISAKVTDGVLTITVGKKLKDPEPEPEPDTEIPWV